MNLLTLYYFVELARELLAGFGMGIQDTGEAEADATPAAQPAQEKAPAEGFKRVCDGFCHFHGHSI